MKIPRQVWLSTAGPQAVVVVTVFAVTNEEKKMDTLLQGAGRKRRDGAVIVTVFVCGVDKVRTPI
jgi:hypothetical protein